MGSMESGFWRTTFIYILHITGFFTTSAEWSRVTPIYVARSSNSCYFHHKITIPNFPGGAWRQPSWLARFNHVLCYAAAAWTLINCLLEPPFSGSVTDTLKILISLSKGLLLRSNTSTYLLTFTNQEYKQTIWRIDIFSIIPPPCILFFHPSPNTAPSGTSNVAGWSQALLSRLHQQSRTNPFLVTICMQIRLHCCDDS